MVDFLGTPSNFLVQSFRNSDSKDLGLRDLGMRFRRMPLHMAAINTSMTDLKLDSLVHTMVVTITNIVITSFITITTMTKIAIAITATPTITLTTQLMITF